MRCVSGERLAHRHCDGQRLPNLLSAARLHTSLGSLTMMVATQIVVGLTLRHAEKETHDEH